MFCFVGIPTFKKVIQQSNIFILFLNIKEHNIFAFIIFYYHEQTSALMLSQIVDLALIVAAKCINEEHHSTFEVNPFAV